MAKKRSSLKHNRSNIKSSIDKFKRPKNGSVKISKSNHSLNPGNCFFNIK